MRKQMISLALVGGLGLGGVALVAPNIAAAADSASSTTTPRATAPVSDRVADRVAHIKDALKGLVGNKTITQAQADAVAAALAAALPPRGGHFGPDGGRLSPEAVAKVLGITVDQLRAGHEAGKTLAQIAASHGISKADLISRLVAAAKAQLAADVTAGRITQAQADEVSTDLTADITERVDRVGPPRGDHARRPGDMPPPYAPSSTTPSSTTTSSTTPSATA